MSLHRVGVVFCVTLLASGCGDDETAPKPTKPPATKGCAPLEVLAADGACIPVGVPAESCAPGFDADGDGGCVPRLPDAPCGPGTMALPGETVCRPVAECGDAPWGNIPVDATTEYVDAAYAGGGSDGSAQKPWTKAQAALDAAAAGSVIAIAAGSYAEAVTVTKAARVYGRCPELVEIAGNVAGQPAVYVFGADGTTVSGLALTGVGYGFAVLHALDVVADHLWVHDTDDRGIIVQDASGPARLRVEDSLVEAATDLGVLDAGAEVTIERSVIRAMRPKKNAASYGYGIAALDDPTTGGRAKLTVHGSVVLGARSAGILVAGSDGEIEATLVRDVLPGSGAAVAGFGIGVELDPSTSAPASLTVRSSVVDHCFDGGIVAGGASLDVETTVVRAIAFGDATTFRGGIIARSVDGVRATLGLRASTIDDVAEAGVLVGGSDATIDGTLARRTVASAEGTLGLGLVLEDSADDKGRTIATVTSSLFEDHPAAGVLVSGSDGVLEGVLVRASAEAAAGAQGRGIEVQADAETAARATATLRACSIDRARDLGLAVFASDATVEDTSIAGTEPRSIDGLFGDGVTAGSGDAGAATLSLARCRVEHSARAGVSTSGASVAFDHTDVLCNPVALAAPSGSGSYSGLESSSCGCDDQTTSCAAGAAAVDPAAPLP